MLTPTSKWSEKLNKVYLFEYLSLRFFEGIRIVDNFMDVLEADVQWAYKHNVTKPFVNTCILESSSCIYTGFNVKWVCIQKIIYSFVQNVDKEGKFRAFCNFYWRLVKLGFPNYRKHSLNNPRRCWCFYDVNNNVSPRGKSL